MSAASSALQNAGGAALPPIKLKEVSPGAGVFYERFDNGIFLELPFPPSTNDRQTVKWRTTKDGRRLPCLANTGQAQGYLNYGPVVATAARLMRLEPVGVYCPVRFTFFMMNEKYDTHNGLKLACDLLEYGRIFQNDRYILPHVEHPLIVREKPRLRVEFSLYDVDPNLDANMPADSPINSPTVKRPKRTQRIWNGVGFVTIDGAQK